MARSTLAVIVGYVTLVAVSAAIFTGAYFAVGIPVAFAGDSFQISPLMAACGMGASFVGGLVGGLVCRKISGRANVHWALAAAAFVLTLASGIPMLMREPPLGRRPPDIQRLDAMTRAFHPRWFTLLFPVTQAAGVWVMTARRRAPRTLE